MVYAKLKNSTTKVYEDRHFENSLKTDSFNPLLKDINIFFKNVSFRSGVIKNLAQSDFVDCCFNTPVKIKSSSNLTFEDIDIGLGNLYSSENILFKNCTIETDQLVWIDDCERIIFKNCTINGEALNISNSDKVIFKNCTMKNLDRAIVSHDSNINIMHSIVQKCDTFLKAEKSEVYVRLIDIDKETDKYIISDSHTSLTIISNPDLLISSI